MSGKEIRNRQIYQVNAFAEGPYRGNPAGVCLLPGEKDADFYRKVAGMMGFSETAFVYKEADGYRLRWFTPNGTEVDLCGHATLGTAYILFSQGYEDTGSTVKFMTRSGLLTAATDGELIRLEFPAEEIIGLDGDAYGLDAALGVRSLYTGRTRYDAFIEVESEDTVKNISPDFVKLKAVPGRGVIVSARSGHDGYDFVSRFFCPKLGIDEDPVTGSAHCALGVYWGHVLQKESLVGYQASAEGGIVRVMVLGEGVLLSGKAIEVPVEPSKARLIC
jgi:PhzF family phenazine biosynthesis protein